MEHKPETIEIADYVVDLGPGAGAAGGTACVVAGVGPTAPLALGPEREQPAAIERVAPALLAEPDPEAGDAPASGSSPAQGAVERPRREPVEASASEAGTVEYEAPPSYEVPAASEAPAPPPPPSTPSDAGGAAGEFGP